jgi:hypothetical protein
MQWITRERPKIDRIACPWLVARFVDPDAEFLYVPSADVQRIAAQTGAIPYDVPGAELGHVGERCSFDAFLSRYRLADPALARLATIVRGADTDRLDLAPQCAATGGDFVRPVEVPHRRPRDAGARHGAVRCAVRLVPGLARAGAPG